MFQRNLLPSPLSTLMMDAAGSSKTLVPIYQSTWHHIPDDCCLYNAELQSFFYYFLLLSKFIFKCSYITKQELIMDIHTIATVVVLSAASRSTLIELNLCDLKHTKHRTLL
jgi:hypothetical protein